jgi:hypothetical protein
MEMKEYRVFVWKHEGKRRLARSRDVRWVLGALSVEIHHPEPKVYHASRKYARIFAFTPTIRLPGDVLL